MYKFILTENDMVRETDFPTIALINEAYNTGILDFIDALNQGIGSGYNYTSCSFWNELDDYDKEHTQRYDGLLIETENDEETILSLSELLYYLELMQKRISETDSMLATTVLNKLNEYKGIYLR